LPNAARTFSPQADDRLPEQFRAPREQRSNLQFAANFHFYFRALFGPGRTTPRTAALHPAFAT
jgi:hypothetical protein